MKTLYLAYTELTVYGWSWKNENDAKQAALSWWKEQDDDGKFDDILIDELNVPDNANDDDFISCARLDEYQEIAEKMKER